MDTIYVKFPNGKAFQASDDINRIENGKVFILFFDKEKLNRYMIIPETKKEIQSGAFLLRPTAEGIRDVTHRDGWFHVIFSGLEAFSSPPEVRLPQSFLDMADQKGYLFLSEKPEQRRYADTISGNLEGIFYSLEVEPPIPLSYSPFSPAFMDYPENKTNHSFLSFGDDHNFTIAYVEDQKISVSGNLGKLETFYEINEMDILVKQIMGHLRLKSVDILRDYNNYSLVAHYLRKFAHVKKINHIFSHLAGTMYDNGKTDQNGIGVVYDSVSYGPDERVQGSEIIYGKPGKFQIIGSWKPIPLPGGDIANIEPWRITLAVIKEVFGGDFTQMDIPLVRHIREKKDSQYLIDAINRGYIDYGLSTSFHHILSAIGELIWYQESTNEPDYFESLINRTAMPDTTDEYYELAIIEEDDITMIDTYDLFRKLVADIFRGTDKQTLTTKVVRSIAKATKVLLTRLADKLKQRKIFLSGEMFKNSQFVQPITDELTDAGFEVYRNHNIPVDDSGIPIGQIILYDILNGK